MVEKRVRNLSKVPAILQPALAIIILALLAWLSILSYILYTIASHYRRLASNSKGEDLKSILEGLLKETEKGSGSLEKIEIEIEKIHLSNLSHIQKVSLVRFNPFADVGGNQSFSICFLDGQDNGVVLSSLHSRVGTRIYAKEVEGGKGKGLELSEEEMRALKLAIRPQRETRPES